MLPAKSVPVLDNLGLSNPVKKRMGNGFAESIWQSVLFTVAA
jgi:hypothetical protein